MGGATRGRHGNDVTVKHHGSVSRRGSSQSGSSLWVGGKRCSQAGTSGQNELAVHRSHRCHGGITTMTWLCHSSFKGTVHPKIKTTAICLIMESRQTSDICNSHRNYRSDEQNYRKRRDKCLELRVNCPFKAALPRDFESMFITLITFC